MTAPDRLAQAADIASRVEWSPCCAPGQLPETLIVDQVLRLVAVDRGLDDGTGLSLAQTRSALTECGRDNLRLRAELDRMSGGWEARVGSRAALEQENTLLRDEVELAKRQHVHAANELAAARSELAELRARRSTGGTAPDAGTAREVWETAPLDGQDTLAERPGS